MVNVPEGGVTVIPASGVVQLPGETDPLAAMLIGQAKTRKLRGATDVKAACHVLTIIA